MSLPINIYIVLVFFPNLNLPKQTCVESVLNGNDHRSLEMWQGKKKKKNTLKGNSEFTQWQAPPIFVKSEMFAFLHSYCIIVCVSLNLKGICIRTPVQQQIGIESRCLKKNHHHLWFFSHWWSWPTVVTIHNISATCVSFTLWFIVHIG